MPLIRYRVAGGAWVEANVTLPFDITAETTEDVEVQGLGTIAIDEGVAAAEQPYVVIAVAGQSNATGNQPMGVYDADRTGVEQYANNSNEAGTFETITTDTTPLRHPIVGATEDRHGPGAAFAARLIANGYIPAGHRVLLVPCARPGTGLADATEPWWAGATEGSLFSGFVAQTNKAIVAAKAINTNSYFGGTIWVQGERDAGQNRSTAVYAAALTELINKSRTQITGASNSFFMIGSMTPERVSSDVDFADIEAAHIQVAGALARTYFHKAATGRTVADPVDTLHFDAEGAETNGLEQANLLLALTTPAVLSSASGTQTGATTATLSVSTTRKDGTLYAVVTTSATTPSEEQIEAGNDHTDTAATFDASKNVTASGANTFSATGLTAATQYYAHFYHETGNPAQASNIISSAGFTTASTGGVDPAAMAAAYIAAMTTAPSTAEQTKIEARFDDLNTAGVLAKLDAMWALDAHTEQAARLNMIDPAAFTLTGAFTHTAGAKATGNGTNVVTTGFNFSTSGTNYTDSGASIGIDLTDTPATGVVMGANASTTIIVNPNTPIGNLAIRIGDLLNASAGGTTGFFAGSNNGVDTSTSYRNGTVVTTAGLGTDDITPNDTLVLFGGNGTPSSHGARFAFVGGHLTQSEIAAIQTAFAVA